MQNFEPESAVISVSSNSALIEKYLRNTCLGQGAVPTPTPVEGIVGVFSTPTHARVDVKSGVACMTTPAPAAPAPAVSPALPPPTPALAVLALTPVPSLSPAIIIPTTSVAFCAMGVGGVRVAPSYKCHKKKQQLF